ncbi:hypothetical protein [Flavilitoribacter nigricans]|uniref:Uncharacterized protein n=1 Tax=Flavilitoribacter nigricans (strain ATCC 23147 / DSM 23189 / NBRC 102662 / NCIMB 1420 / SS-2) TaxID=1122177 RepID=A0A2D0NGM6_FLAN2|nr:hypothetical protein [Flavilitoribacter nigricans]PHN07540.1 hypothetical protein CRP01_05410 [Flavilitoribacter nigricans DSM 23189 = NBRC 102662]
MKIQSILVVVALMAIVPFSYGQNQQTLTGPQAKNFKLMGQDHPAVTVADTETESVESLTGPAAKNQKHRYRAAGVQTDYSAISNPKFMGPKAKNYKFWKNREQEVSALPKGKMNRKDQTSLFK